MENKYQILSKRKAKINKNKKSIAGIKGCQLKGIRYHKTKD